MRPRVFPAEDPGRARPVHLHVEAASMRPRVFPAEDSSARGWSTGSTRSSFNEAAGIPRGRRQRGQRERPGFLSFNEAAGIPRGRPPACRYCCCQSRPASMRPRVFPAEDSRSSTLSLPASGSFNEAAGIPRGRHAGAPVPTPGAGSFNEAAGIPRGRRPQR